MQNSNELTIQESQHCTIRSLKQTIPSVESTIFQNINTAEANKQPIEQSAQNSKQTSQTNQRPIKRNTTTLHITRTHTRHSSSPTSEAIKSSYFQYYFYLTEPSTCRTRESRQLPTYPSDQFSFVREVVLHERTTSVSIDQVLGCTPTVCCLVVSLAC